MTKILSSKTFDERYARLNPRQREAVDTVEGPVMVIAGPGTGKTTILTLRIANILRLTDTPPSGILAITYTEAGVKAMRQKLREVIGGRADEVRIHTFHGFASSVIKEFDEHFIGIARFEQMTEAESASILRAALAEKKFVQLRPLGDPDFYIPKILGAVSESKREGYTPEMLAASAEDEIKRIEGDEDSISTRGASKGKLKADAEKRIEKAKRTILMSEAYVAYEAAKRAQKKLDFDDLIFELLLALKRDELLLHLIQEKFLYILVDEHQDTNDAQNEIVRIVADFFESPNLFVVGDEKQAIYRFQGASVENFLKFQSAWAAMKVISLEDNYRSHQGLLDAGFSLIENNYAEGEHMALRTRLVAGGKEARKPLDIVSAGDIEALEGRLVADIKGILDKGELKGGAASSETVAVIVRRNKDVARLLSVFRAQGISAAAERGADVFAHPIGMLFFDLARYFSDPGQVEALARTIAAGLWGLEFAERAALVRAIKSGQLDSLESKIPNLVALRRAMTKLSPLEFALRAALDSGLLRMAASDPLSAEVWRSIVAICAEVSARGSLESAAELMREIATMDISSGKQAKARVGAPDARVHVMTAHGSKGLEFDHVFMPYATEEAWMSAPRASYFILPFAKGDEDYIRDARRLFYVALTRARKHATILFAAEDRDGHILTPVRFIDELDAASIARISVPATREVSVKAAEQAKEAGATAERREMVDYAKRMLVESGLSVTGLNHFIECPMLFFYKSVLKLPEPPSASSEKGTAMHEAISRAWGLDAESISPVSVQGVLDAGVREYMAKSLLNRGDKEAVLAELEKAMPSVAAFLAEHFAPAKADPSASVSTESWFEKPFGEIRLHGKLDAVVETERAVSVYDYKTREAMSEAEIKGETKSSKLGAPGAYFRQLVFYTLLLEGDKIAREKPVLPALVFVKPDKKGTCKSISLPVEPAERDRVKAEIQTLIDSVWSGKFLDEGCNEEDCQWCALAKLR